MSGRPEGPAKHGPGNATAKMRAGNFAIHLIISRILVVL